MSALSVPAEDVARGKTVEAIPDVEVNVKRVTEMENEPSGQFGLTGAQDETLTTTHRMGSVEVDRVATVDDRAKELGVSARSVADRLRRTHSKRAEGAHPMAIEETGSGDGDTEPRWGVLSRPETTRPRL